MMLFLMWLILKFTKALGSKRTTKLDSSHKKEVPYIVFMRNQ